jgi:hypothetical protein
MYAAMNARMNRFMTWEVIARAEKAGELLTREAVP